MELALPKTADTYEYVLTDPNETRYETVFVLAGATHPSRETLEKKRGNRALREIKKKGKPEGPEDIDDAFDEQTEWLVVCTVGWRDLKNADGSQVAFSPEVARELYESKSFRWIRQAVIGALADPKNFMTSSSSS